MTRRSSWRRNWNNFCLVSEQELKLLKWINKTSIYSWDLELLLEEWVLGVIDKIINKYQYAQKLRLLTWEMKGKEQEIHDWVDMLEWLKKEFQSIEEKMEDYAKKMAEKKLPKTKK